MYKVSVASNWVRLYVTLYVTQVPLTKGVAFATSKLILEQCTI